MFMYNIIDYFGAHSNPVKWVVVLVVATWVAFSTEQIINDKVEYEVYSIETGSVLSRTEYRLKAYDLFETAKLIYQSKIGLRKVTKKEIEILEEEK